MKKFLPALFVILGLALIGKSFAPVRNTSAFDLDAFGRLPVVVNGRVKPLDTVARTSLLVLQGRQRVGTPERSDPFVDTPTEWLADVFFRSEKADTYPTFRIESPELLDVLGITAADTHVNYDSAVKRGMALVGFLPSTKSRFSFKQIEPKLSELERQAKLAEPVEAAVRSPFQRAVVQLYANVALYFRLKSSLVAPDHKDFLGELIAFQNSVSAGVAAVRAKQANQPHDEALVSQMLDSGSRFDHMSQLAYLLSVPPDDGEANIGGWQKVGASLLNTFQSGRISPSIMVYAGLERTWNANQADKFNEVLRLYRAQLEKNFPSTLKHCDAETRYNAAQPFYTAITLYVLAFIIAVVSWLRCPVELGRAAFWLIALAWLLATYGIAMRMWLEGRPPVTNLYSSALFVGWIAVAFCLALEYIYRNAIGSVAAGLIGFGTLLIGYYLSLDGDTLEMMRAVLDSNFWLSTHVVTVTAGYGATFLAGFLGLIYIVRGVFTPSLDKGTADALSRMTYGIVCFATLFSLVGTILGGIWADQSWGRFWGWDPKENGALMIVVWNALLLHARWGGLVKQRGLAALAVFGNIVTSWSWFGVNMLGVGLHSYGFMDSAFFWLVAFVLSQLAFIGVALLPLAKWRSFRASAAA